MNTIDIIRGLLRGHFLCGACRQRTATRNGRRIDPPLLCDDRGVFCDECQCNDPRDLEDAGSIRAAERWIAEHEATPSGERVVWSDDGLRIVADGAGRIWCEAPRCGEWVELDEERIPQRARPFLARAALAYVGAADTTMDRNALSLVLRRAAGQILGYSDRFNDEHRFTLGDIAACMRLQLATPPLIEWARRSVDGARAWLAVYATIAPEPDATADTEPAPAVDGGAA